MSKQLDLSGKEAVKKKKCKQCENYLPESELYGGVIYQPFNDEPSFEYEQLCERCEMYLLDNTMYCEMCDRQIFESNGYRGNLRVYPEFPFPYYEENTYEPDVVCVRCCQEIWFEYGMENFKDADWFSEQELIESDFEKHKHYFCREKESYEKAEKEFNRLRKEGYAVLVSLEASGMGLEHHFSIWKKEMR